jgi:uncharacterized protein (TIGR02271 family)
MTEKKDPAAAIISQHTRFPKGIVTGAITGAALVAMSGFLGKIGVLTIPGFANIPAVNPVTAALSGIILGIIIGGGIGGLIGLYSPGKFHQSHPTVPEQVLKNAEDAATLQLREEQLDISKKWLRIGDVSIHKEILKEEKNITVPIVREELVIEKRVFNKKAQDQQDLPKEIFRIPVRTERIEITKHPVLLNKVSIFRHKLQKNERIDETVKKEKLRIKATGKPKIVNK